MRRLFAVVIVVGTIVPASAWAGEGDLDLSFNGTGEAVTPMGTQTDSDAANSVMIDSQDRVVAVGQTRNSAGGFAVARYRPNGGLDATFNGSGTAVTAVGNDSSAKAGTIDGQGRIVLAGIDQGSGGPLDSDFAIARFSPNGKLDQSLDGTGKVETPITMTIDQAYAVKTDSQNRIIACGFTAGTGEDFGLVRYQVNGKTDGGFGSGGVVKTDFASGTDQCKALAIDAQGRIVAAGQATVAGHTEFAVARYTSNGRLDHTFGTGGKVMVALKTMAFAMGMTIDSSGRIVLVGTAEDATQNYSALVRLSPGGQPDPTFGTGGAVFGSAGTTLSGVTVDAQGRIVAAGMASNGTGTQDLLVRYEPNGKLDTTFNGTGIVLTQVEQSSYADAVAIDQHDRIVTGGSASDTNNVSHFAIVRYIGDATPPRASIASGPVNGSFTNSRRPRFTFASSEPGSTFECRIDLLALTACASPYTPGVSLADGRHTFGVVAIDRAGNASAQAQRTFTIDTRAPRITIERRRRQFRINASEPVTLTCAFDKRRAKTCRSPVKPPKLEPGKHTLHVTATDRAGNVTRASKRFTVKRRHR